MLVLVNAGHPLDDGLQDDKHAVQFTKSSPEEESSSVGWSLTKVGGQYEKMWDRYVKLGRRYEKVWDRYVKVLGGGPRD